MPAALAPAPRSAAEACADCSRAPLVDSVGSWGYK
jgi:hypothetical protein